MGKFNFSQNLKYLILCIAVILFKSCGSERVNEVIYLFSEDKKQVITVYTDVKKDIRFIADGKHVSKPKSNYFKLDISNISEIGDEIGIC